MSESEQGAVAPAVVRVPAGVTPGTVGPASRTPARPGDDASTDPQVDGSTGDGAVDRALQRLVDLDEQDLRTQASAFEDVHAALQARLADAEG